MGFTHMIYKWYRDIVVFSLSFLMRKFWTSSPSLACARSFSPLSKLPTSARTFTACAYRWRFFIRCFGRRPAASSPHYIPETRLVMPKCRCFENLQQGRPPTTTFSQIMCSFGLNNITYPNGNYPCNLSSTTPRLVSIVVDSVLLKVEPKWYVL